MDVGPSPGYGPPDAVSVEPAYPVRLRGTLDEPLVQFLWLVKWLLALPHLIVLAVLGVVGFLLTIVAGISIAFTGRYPRGIFDFNVGVMRWSWRVQFYAFALGTDRYPRFSLAADPSYPAQLEIPYPETLSRGKVWVKWWLLAIPHYLVVGAFFGGFGSGDTGQGLALSSILGVIAGVTLVVRHRYPQPLFDFIMGLYRWSWRVIAYAALMRDEYPPFRLDMGPDEPVGPVVPPAPLS